jgi:hypothetical protein
MCLNRMIAGAGLLALLLGGLSAAPSLRAQPATRKVDNRVLLVFDTSAEMKRRLPAVQKAVETLLATNLSRQLRSNDTIGVWTFDQELRTGQFPLQSWKPDNVALTASTINAFVGSQRYAKKTRLEAVLPLLSQLVQSSERLTAVIFCDGYGELHGTPYDSGVNQIFLQRREERQKAKQPIAVVLRSQLGEYVDCMVSFPPQPVSLPEFPPLPEPPAPPPQTATPPRPATPPLIIIGTPPPSRPAAPPPAPTNPPPPAVTSPPAPPEAQAPNPPEVVPQAPPAQTGAASAPLTIVPALLPQTNALSAAADGSGANPKAMRLPGVILLAAAAGLAAFWLGRVWPKKKN